MTHHNPAITGLDAELVAARIDVAWRLFEAWSSGNIDAPRQFLDEDAVLYDSVGGEKVGWANIREYFAHGLERYPDLALVPTGDFWARPDGLAMLWRMSATNHNPDAGEVGRVWIVDGLSYLIFDGLTVIREADYHDAGARARSLQS